MQARNSLYLKGRFYWKKEWDRGRVMSQYKYYGGGHLLQVNLPAPGCAGAREAIDVTVVIGSVMLLIPAAQGAGGITLLFAGILGLAYDAWC